MKFSQRKLLNLNVVSLPNQNEQQSNHRQQITQFSPRSSHISKKNQTESNGSRSIMDYGFFLSFVVTKEESHCFQGASSCWSTHDKKQLSNKQKVLTYRSWYLTGVNLKFATWTIGHIAPSRISAGRKSLFTSSFTCGRVFPEAKPM